MQWERVHAEATGEIALGIVNLEEGGTGEDDVELGIVVVEVFDGTYPTDVFVDLIEEEVGDTVSVEVFDQFGDGMAAEPDIVKRGIEGFGAVGEGNIFLVIVQPDFVAFTRQRYEMFLCRERK